MNKNDGYTIIFLIKKLSVNSLRYMFFLDKKKISKKKKNLTE